MIFFYTVVLQIIYTLFRNYLITTIVIFVIINFFNIQVLIFYNYTWLHNADWRLFYKCNSEQFDRCRARMRCHTGRSILFSSPPIERMKGKSRSKINPGRRDAYQLQLPHVSPIRFLAITTPVVTRRRRRWRPTDDCCSPGYGGRRGAASDSVRLNVAVRRTDWPGVATTPEHDLESATVNSRLSLCTCTPGPVVRQTTSSVWRAAPSDVVGPASPRTSTAVHGMYTVHSPYVSRAERRGARAP